LKYSTEALGGHPFDEEPSVGDDAVFGPKGVLKRPGEEETRNSHASRSLELTVTYVQRRLATFPPPLLDLGSKHAKTVKKPIQLHFSLDCECSLAV
jgi:hypothetical protein